ncbi:MAG: site-specific DNA-methyltransferase [Candidatus Liptonbacteria bacterium]|nr:site-specific DNA-methyltransferase [Candidatus Liptonbacteria bacterium]
MKRITLKRKFSTAAESSLIFGDALNILRSIPSHSIDHCITDPPYNISGYDYKKKIGWLQSNSAWVEEKNFSKIDARWDKFSDNDYLAFTKSWISEVARVLKPNGNIIIFGSYHNIYQIGSILQDIDRKLINSVVWYKRNAFPNVTQRMLCESTEHIIWAVNETKKNAKNWTFNYKALKELNGGVQMRNMWDIPSTPVSEKRHGKHPSQKPIELISRLVLGGTNKKDIIIDPFMGSGTLPVVALVNERGFVGIDNDKQYCNLALKRVVDTRNHPKQNKVT